MTGPRELTVLQAFRAMGLSSPDERSAAALQSIAVSLAALADLYEMEVACLAEFDGDEDGEEARIS